MGYNMRMRNSKFHIDRINVDRACRVWKAAGETIAVIGDDSIVDTDSRWAFRRDRETGDVTDIYFLGDKLYDEDDWFFEIAKFVEEGSFIEMEGEDGYIWRWVFKDGKSYSITPVITWPVPGDDECIDEASELKNNREQKICEILKLHVNEMYEVKKLVEGGFWAEMEFGIEWFQCETPFDAKVRSNEPLTFDDGFRVGYEAFTILVSDLLTATEKELDEELQMLEEDVKK